MSNLKDDCPDGSDESGSASSLEQDDKLKWSREKREKGANSKKLTGARSKWENCQGARDVDPFYRASKLDSYHGC